MVKMLLFNRWDTEGITVLDQGLQRYVSLHPLILPKTGGKNVRTVFWKSKNHIVERLITKLMVPGHKGKKHRLSSGHCTGKGISRYEIVKRTFELIEKKTGKNPVEVFVRALENAAPREEITTIEYGGARYPKAVECSPQRRIDIALRMMTQGAYTKSFNSKAKVEQTLADEILKAYNEDQSSNAIAKKLELERQADASR